MGSLRFSMGAGGVEDEKPRDVASLQPRSVRAPSVRAEVGVALFGE